VSVLLPLAWGDHGVEVILAGLDARSSRFYERLRGVV
jgi:hypothetical protein